ncbi:unnamed protein product [Rotaria socialis]|uniref:Uncharacterized protein n=2 Tax=Rotaria socialis TaxID=392032 RepID=A0A819ZPA9_9BILA|nr:unnamed protein product [Rotaria socialis]CAF4166362.1 unnamed protein product [Rotaria socialis]
MFKNIPIKTVINGHEKQFDNEQLVSMIHRLADERDVLWRENEYLKAKLNESILIETINEMRKERDLLLKLLLNLSVNRNNDGQLPYTDEHTNGYSNDLLPPPPYQTYNTLPNSKSQLNSSPPTKKHSSHYRQNPTPMVHRDLSIPVTELKPHRRSHRTRQSVEQPQQTQLQQQQQQQQQQPSAIYRVEGTKECLMNPDELSSVFAHVKHSHPNKKIVVYKTSTTPQTHEFNQLVDEMCVKHGVELKHSQNSPFHQYRSQSLQDLTSTTLPLQRDFDFQFKPIEKQELIRTSYTKRNDN